MAAQEALPDTPPELRDFRLDPERPVPEPGPQVQPPPVVPNDQSEAPPAESPRVARPPAQENPSPRADASVREAEPEVIPETVLPPVTSPTADEAEPLPQVTRPLPEPALPAAEPSALPDWHILLSLLGAFVLLGAWLLRTRRRVRVEPRSAARAPELTASTRKPDVPPQPAPLAASASPRPQIALEFIPDKATLGFSSLTLKGQLRIVNNGSALATNLQLRTTMISAGPRQTETIVAFQGGDIPVAPNAIGFADKGAQIALDVEIALPIASLESYIIGEKRIFVPVMLANLSYDWDGGSDNVTLACMVGRETDPPQSKMGPFRLDRGPRTFAPIGQRVLTT